VKTEEMNGDEMSSGEGEVVEVSKPRCHKRPNRRKSMVAKKRGHCPICGRKSAPRWRYSEVHCAKVCDKCFAEGKQSFQDVYVKESTIAGRGLFALHSFEAGDMICFYAGSEDRRAPPFVRKNDETDDSRMVKGANLSEDANLQMRPCLGHFANGAPENFNAHYQIKVVNGQRRFVLFANKHIEMDEEIICDYGNPKYFEAFK